VGLSKGDQRNALKSGRDTTPQVPQKNLKSELFLSDLYKQPDHFLLVSQPEMMTSQSGECDGNVTIMFLSHLGVTQNAV